MAGASELACESPHTMKDGAAELPRGHKFIVAINEFGGQFVLLSHCGLFSQSELTPRLIVNCESLRNRCGTPLLK